MRTVNRSLLITAAVILGIVLFLLPKESIQRGAWIAENESVEEVQHALQWYCGHALSSLPLPDVYAVSLSGDELHVATAPQYRSHAWQDIAVPEKTLFSPVLYTLYGVRVGKAVQRDGLERLPVELILQLREPSPLLLMLEQRGERWDVVRGSARSLAQWREHQDQRISVPVEMVRGIYGWYLPLRR